MTKCNNSCDLHIKGKFQHWACGKYDPKIRRSIYQSHSKNCIKCQKKISQFATWCRKCAPSHVAWNKGKPHLAGDKNPAWKHGLSKTKEYRTHIQQIREFRKRTNGGSFSFEEWMDLKAQYNFTCPSCLKREPEIQLQRDHVMPIALGGQNTIDNIQPLCAYCNNSKRINHIRYASRSCWEDQI